MIDASNAPITREPHAAHYMGSGGHGGHDLEWIDVIALELKQVVNLPRGFAYHSGYLDRGKNQHWMFCRRAPLSPERCRRCQ